MRDTQAAQISRETGAFTWWHVSILPGDPRCLCSVCLEPIGEEDDNDAVPIVLWTEDYRLTAHFHPECVPPALFSQQKEQPKGD